MSIELTLSFQGVLFLRNEFQALRLGDFIFLFCTVVNFLFLYMCLFLVRYTNDKRYQNNTGKKSAIEHMLIGYGFNGFDTVFSQSLSEILNLPIFVV